MPSKAKENILHRIKQALATPVPVPFPDIDNHETVVQPAVQELEIQFAESFTKLQGNFSFCVNEAEMVNQLLELAAHKGWTKFFCNDEQLKSIFSACQWPFDWHTDLATCNASITACEMQVARTGTMVLSSGASGGRTPSVYAPTHICLATTRQLVYDIKDALQILQQQYGPKLPSSISFASGPSRTADIEKTLVTGVHGPKEVFCFLIESN